jgi:NAD(P)H-flavin reductase
MVIRNVGRVTDVLHQCRNGDRIGIRGPFGSTFPVAEAMAGKDLLFICGGIGLVPVRSAIDYVLDRRDEYGDVAILYGSRTPADRLFIEELTEWEQRPDVSFLETVDRADEAWSGNVGVITTLIPKIAIDPETTIAIICGLPIMYKFVIVELDGANLSGENVYVSLERRMKCGVGKCGHCQINGLYTCIDGPVFRYADVTDVQEAI